MRAGAAGGARPGPVSGALQREPLPWRAAVKLQGVRIHLPLSGIGRSVEHTLYDSLCILLSCGCPNRLGELPGDRFIVRRVGIRGFIVLRRCDGGGRFGRWWCLGFRGERMGRCKDELSGIQLYDVTAALLPCDAPLYPVCGNYFVAVGVLYGFGVTIRATSSGAMPASVPVSMSYCSCLARFSASACCSMI